MQWQQRDLQVLSTASSHPHRIESTPIMFHDEEVYNFSFLGPGTSSNNKRPVLKNCCQMTSDDKINTKISSMKWLYFFITKERVNFHFTDCWSCFCWDIIEHEVFFYMKYIHCPFKNIILPSDANSEMIWQEHSEKP